MTETADRTAQELIIEHLPLVERIAGEVRRRLPEYVSREDLVAAGAAALVAAAHSFAPERGVPFAGFAVGRIRGAILDELRQLDWASRSVRRQGRLVEAARQELTATLYRSPTDAELAARLGLAASELALANSDRRRATVLSLDSLTESTGKDLASTAEAGPEELAVRHEQLVELRAAIDTLPTRLRVVIVRYYLEECPVAALAQEFGVSCSRISQLRSEGLGLLREAIGERAGGELIGRLRQRSGSPAARFTASGTRGPAPRHRSPEQLAA